jgi:hypothetical protein
VPAQREGTCFEQILIRGIGPNIRYPVCMVDMRYNVYVFCVLIVNFVYLNYILGGIRFLG